MEAAVRGWDWNGLPMERLGDGVVVFVDNDDGLSRVVIDDPGSWKENALTL